MLIRINLLAEAQALEELRRRDPVKRAVWVGGFLVSIMLVWSRSLQVKAFMAKGELNRIESALNSHTNEYQQVQESQQKLAQVNSKLTALHQLSTNRFLNGSMLDALQHATLEDIQLVHLKVEQAYLPTPEVKPRTNGDRIIPGKPGTVAEKTVVVIEAKDLSSNPGDLMDKYKQTIASSPYFGAILTKSNDVRLVNYGTRELGDNGKPFLLFTLECRYPEKVR
jgi:hypothetical protein